MHRAAHVYNLSFCLEPDLLSQWRGYGSSQGVCLEFDDEELLASLELTHYQVFKNRVLYTKEDSTVEARNEILAFFRQPRKRKLTAVCSHQTRIGNLDAHLI
ncbi:TPA: DUF2971 domain-containing protein [Escherichia coli]